MRRFEDLARDWRRRTFGPRTAFYFWTILGGLTVIALMWTPSGWKFGVGLAVGMVGTAFCNAARALERVIDEALGFPVAVYPIVVIWGHFTPGVQHAGGVMYVAGEELADWLRSRPADLRDERKRKMVCEWLLSLPRA